MASKSSQSSNSKQAKKSKVPVSKANLVKLGTPPSAATVAPKRFDPLTAFALNRSASPALSPHHDHEKKSQGSIKPTRKGKERATNVIEIDDANDRLWVDIYEPGTESELAVHVKKVEDVRRWLMEAFDGGPSGKLTKYRRILALTGPAGTGKTSTVRVLAREMGFEILEWRNSMGETSTSHNESQEGFSSNNSNGFNTFDPDYENLFTKFEAFLNRASSCKSIFSEKLSNSSIPSQPHTSTQAPPLRRRIILLEDLPNILHLRTQAQFHAALRALVETPPSNPPVPLIIIISDAGIRGEVGDERMSNGMWGKEKDQMLDVRTVLSKELLASPYTTQIGFNPIASTLMRKAIQALINTHFSSDASTRIASPSKEVIDIIVESANGDIRSAIMALQFACVVELQPLTGRGKRNKKKGSGTKIVLEAVSRREQSLALFHLLGKVLYNKRKGDPSSSSATAKDIQQDAEFDSKLKDPWPLPEYLQEHNRRTSRVDVDLLYSDSPIDSSLFSLYIHQNYTQFCDELEQCDGVAECLSWVDSSGGEAWYQANPHSFHLLALGTLHALPSPVIRRSQRILKPEFFDFLRREKDAQDEVRNVCNWLVESATKDDITWRTGAWTKNDAAVELGGVLKAREKMTIFVPSKPPKSHQLFSKMAFVHSSGSSQAQQLVEGGNDSGYEFEDENDLLVRTQKRKEEDNNGGWLEGDDIDDFE